jgi:hypothetical protein
MARVSEAPEELVKPVNSLTAFSFRPGEEVFDGLQFRQGLGVLATGGDINL